VILSPQRHRSKGRTCVCQLFLSTRNHTYPSACIVGKWFICYAGRVYGSMHNATAWCLSLCLLHRSLYSKWLIRCSFQRGQRTFFSTVRGLREFTRFVWWIQTVIIIIGAVIQVDDDAQKMMEKLRKDKILRSSIDVRNISYFRIKWNDVENCNPSDDPEYLQRFSADFCKKVWKLLLSIGEGSEVLLWVCLSVCLCVSLLDSSKNMWSNFTNFFMLTVAIWLNPSLRHYDMLCRGWVTNVTSPPPIKKLLAISWLMPCFFLNQILPTNRQFIFTHLYQIWEFMLNVNEFSSGLNAR